MFPCMLQLSGVCLLDYLPYYKEARMCSVESEILSGASSYVFHCSLWTCRLPTDQYTFMADADIVTRNGRFDGQKGDCS